MTGVCVVMKMTSYTVMPDSAITRSDGRANCCEAQPAAECTPLMDWMDGCRRAKESLYLIQVRVLL